jgi:ferric-dicitrate binding protein FerR (iron transport regulator)
MTVSVVGTVFVVNASEDGSRVGVIEGEVRVSEITRQQKLETRLFPGQQVSTSRRSAARRSRRTSPGAGMRMRTGRSWPRS